MTLEQAQTIVAAGHALLARHKCTECDTLAATRTLTIVIMHHAGQHGTTREAHRLCRACMPRVLARTANAPAMLVQAMITDGDAQ